MGRKTDDEPGSNQRHYTTGKWVPPVADPESFHWVDIQYINSTPQYSVTLVVGNLG
jgi:hypothetical protein